MRMGFSPRCKVRHQDYIQVSSQKQRSEGSQLPTRGGLKSGEEKLALVAKNGPGSKYSVFKGPYTTQDLSQGTT